MIKDLDKEVTYHTDYGNEPLDSAEDERINDYICVSKMNNTIYD